MVWGKIITSVLATIFLIFIALGVNLDLKEKPSATYEYANNIILKEDNQIIPSIESPSDRLKESNIKIYKNRVQIELAGAVIAKFTDTKSMEPIINKHTNAIEIVPKSEDEINVGDIISFKSSLVDGIIIHRVIQKDKDEFGVYFRTKGDNLDYADPEIIRFNQIERVVVGVLY